MVFLVVCFVLVDWQLGVAKCLSYSFRVYHAVTTVLEVYKGLNPGSALALVLIRLLSCLTTL